MLSNEELAKYFQQWIYVQQIQLKAQQAMLKTTLDNSLINITNKVFEALNKKRPGK